MKRTRMKSWEITTGDGQRYYVVNADELDAEMRDRTRKQNSLLWHLQHPEPFVPRNVGEVD